MVEIEIGPNLVTMGTFVLSWHGFFSFIAVGSAIFLVGRWAPMKGIDPDDIYPIALWAIIGGTLYALWAKHPVGVIADLTAPAMLFAQTIGRLGDIVNGEHCAKATDFFLGFMWTNVSSDAGNCDNGINISVYPVIAIEMLWNMAALFVIWKLRGRLRPDGMLFALYLALYSIGRFAVTFAREDRIWSLGMQEAQYIALIVLAITIPLLVRNARLRPVEAAAEPVSAPRPRGTRAERRRRNR
jgi:phosphatidylglycerol:prolipoprotein diacylglycerol transferase